MTEDEANRIIVLWNVGQRAEAMLLFASVKGLTVASKPGARVRSFDNLHTEWKRFLSFRGIYYPPDQIYEDGEQFGIRIPRVQVTPLKVFK